MRLRVLSYNIHKGFNATKLARTLEGIKKSIDVVHADLVCLQEIVGEHEVHGDQLEVLADKVWTNYAYGKNAVYSKGHHGNAILSKYPILRSENINISCHKLENRGFLHVQLDVPQLERPLHLICTHLALLHVWRKQQLQALNDFIVQSKLHREPIIVCGDFNDWNTYATKYLNHSLDFREVFYHHHGKHARTYPSWLPVLPLDRIYFSGLKLSSSKLLSGKIWNRLSDHIPILAEFDL